MKGIVPMIAAIILVGAFLYIAGSGLMPEGGLASLLPADMTGDCPDIFCNDYEFICCGLSKTSDASFVSDCSLFNCENWQTCNAQECRITQISVPSGYVAYCSPSCTVEVQRANGVKQTYSMSNNIILYRNDKIRSSSAKLVFYYTTWEQSLKWCGDSSCGSDASFGIIGNEVWGADGCSYVTDKNLYDKSGTLLKTPSGSQISYTVNLGSCMLSTKSRFVCGNTCEECSSNADCVAGHTFVYNGMGAECSTGMLQMYGCRNYGTKPSQDQLDVLPFDQTTSYNYGSRCEVIQTIPVQCCPASSTCGSNAVCDPQTFTCKQTQQVGCTADWQCGTNQVYDQPTKEIRKPVCRLGTCTYDVVQKVDCYYNSECPAGYYCDVDYTCKQSSAPKTSCPLTCCIDDPRYFERPCPSAAPVCCPDGMACKDSLDACYEEGHGKKPEPNWFLILFGALILSIVPAIIFYIIPFTRPIAIFLLNPIIIIVLFAAFALFFASIALSAGSLVASMVSA